MKVRGGGGYLAKIVRNWGIPGWTTANSPDFDR
jgi:hypothetical protein